MARPTNVIARAVKTPEEERSEALETLLEHASDHAAALLAALALVQALHEQGALEALTALSQQGDAALGVALETLSQSPGYAQGAKNALALAQSLATLDDQTVATTQRMVTGGVQAFASAKPPAKSLSVFDLLRALKDPDVSAGLTAVLALLKGVGAALRQPDAAR